MFSPSSIYRVAKCPVSETLPHLQVETEYSAAGTVAHQLFRDVRELGREKALAKARSEVEDAEQLAVLEAMPFDDPRMPSLSPDAYTAEMAFALDLVAGTARVLGKGLTREQAHALARPGEMVGTADLAGVAGKSGVIWDLKFGHGRVPRAAVNAQTATYLLMLVLALELEEGHQGIVRVWGEDDVWTEAVQMDALELGDHLDRLRNLAAEVDRLQRLPPHERPAPREGPWCGYCPAYLHCPAKLALLREVLRDPAGAIPAPAGDGGPDREELGRGWRRLRAAKDVIERAEAVYKGLARITPIPLGEGEVLGEKVTESESLLGWRAAQVLPTKLQLGQLVVEDARSEMSWSALERALKKHVVPTLPRKPNGKPRPFSELERDVRQMLREGGAMKPTVIRRIVEHVPKKDAPAPEPKAEP